MKRKFSLIAPLMVLALVLQASVGLFQEAGAQVRTSDGPRKAPKALSLAGKASVIVELESESVAAYELASRVRSGVRIESIGEGRGVDFHSSRARAHEARLASEQSSFTSRARQLSPGLRVVAELRKLVNAVSVEVPAEDLPAIAALPGVKRVERVKEYRAATDTSVPLINAAAAWERLGGANAAGRGVKIAILDTGIDLSNPLFSDADYEMPEGFPKFNNDNQQFTNKKVIAAKSFVSGTSSAEDENGHGTNVAGIAAGNFGTPSPLGLISGVAPRAYLGNYRVLNSAGSGRSDLIADAIEQAAEDGFDVLNMSLGGEADPELNVLDRSVEAAVAAGKVVVVSAGNTGNGGIGDEETIGSPGVAPHAITVAAATNGHTVGPVVSLTGPEPIASSLVNIASSSGNAITLEGNLVSVPVAEVGESRACSALPANSLDGKVALVERGNCDFAAKVNAAAAAGAIAVVVYNKDISEGEDGGEQMINMEVTGTNIPSVFVRRSAGLALRDFIRSNASATIAIAPLGSASAPADVIGDFSARGPSIQHALKPDIAAPGTVVYSGAIRTANPDGVSDPSGFTSVSGTSQAAPHVAGAAALLRQLHPAWTPDQIKSALMNSATSDVFNTIAKTTKAGILATGAGRVDLGRASNISALFSPASLSFGLNKLKKKPVTLTADLTVTGEGGGINNYAISVEQLDPDSGIEVVLSTNSISIGSGQTTTVSVTINAVKSAPKRSYTGFVIFTDQSGQTLRVPYWVQYKKKL
jgi:subtilisin family serine protease